MSMALKYSIRVNRRVLDHLAQAGGNIEKDEMKSFRWVPSFSQPKWNHMKAEPSSQSLFCPF